MDRSETIGSSMLNESIKAVLFDFGGVLAEEGFSNGLVAMAREQNLDVDNMPSAGMNAVYDSGYVLGQGTVSDFWALLRKRTSLHGDEEILTERILNGFVLRPWMMALVRRLRDQGYITGILSDQSDWLDRLDEKYQFKGEFDHIFNSYYLGKGKQDPSLFAEIAVALGLPPSAILFVDDNAGNVARARSAGMLAIHYIDRERCEEELDFHSTIIR